MLRPAAAAAGRWRVFLLVHAIAAAICVGWLAGFLASADTMGRAPVPWHPWGELPTRLVSGELFAAHRAWVGPLALLGLGLALRRGAALAWLTACLLLATLVLASDAAITVLRLDLLVSAFKNIQFPRYAIVLKPLSSRGALPPRRRLSRLPAYPRTIMRAPQRALRSRARDRHRRRARRRVFRRPVSTSRRP